MQDPLNPVQVVKVSLSNGTTMQATVDVWIAALIEVIDDELRLAWLNTVLHKIQEIQKAPKLFVPGRG